MSGGKLRKWIRRWLLVIILFPIVYLLRPVFWTPLDFRFYNYFHSKRTVPEWTEVVVVSIDEATCSEVFENPVYPLSRHIDAHALVVEQLVAADARAIVFDLQLTEDVFDRPPDRLADAFRSSGKVHLVMSLLGQREFDSSTSI